MTNLHAIKILELVSTKQSLIRVFACTQQPTVDINLFHWTKTISSGSLLSLCVVFTHRSMPVYGLMKPTSKPKISRTAREVDMSLSDRHTIRLILSTSQVNSRLYRAFDMASLKEEEIVNLLKTLFEPRREKTGFLHIRKQRRRSASRLPRS